MIVVVLLLDVWLGGGGGVTTPGESIVPANAEIASANVRIDTAHTRRIFFIFCNLPENTKIFV